VARIGDVKYAMVKPHIDPTPTALCRALWLSLMLVISGPAMVRAQLPQSSLSVRTPAGERLWWRSACCAMAGCCSDAHTLTVDDNCPNSRGTGLG